MEAVGRILSEALRSGLDDEASCSEHLEPLARAWQHGDGKALMESLLTESPSGSPWSHLLPVGRSDE